jgi:acetyltransferase
LKDAALRVPPLHAADACEMIGSLKGKAILQGARGRAKSDVDALVKAIVHFSQLCLDLKDDVKEIDINPLMVFAEGKGAKALDCLIVPT